MGGKTATINTFMLQMQLKDSLYKFAAFSFFFLEHAVKALVMSGGKQRLEEKKMT